MKKTALLLLLVLLFALCVNAQERPLITEDVDITPPGTMNIAAGVDLLQDAKFPLSGLKGDLTRVGDVRIRTGLAPNVELQIEGVAQEFLAINSESPNPPIPLTLDGNSTNDFGDILMSVKVKLRNETARVPALGLKFGYQMPNSDEKRGIGTNQINIFSKMIMQKTFGKHSKQTPRLKVFGNLGIGIMTAPLEAFSQNDVFLYGLGGIYRASDNINVVSEVNGRISTQGGDAPLGTESVGQFRIGTQIKASGLMFDAAAVIGLTKFSPRTGVTFGVTYQSPNVFTPAQ
ncbi:MAG: hypothetical protein ACK5NT_00985 [Pyrinomonadaceae bacterium]